MIRAGIPVLMLAVLLVGCGGSAGQHGSIAVVTTTTSPPLSPGVSSAPVTSPGDTSQNTTTTAPAGDHGPQWFRLPSGNIGCYVDPTAVRCDIGQRDWTPPPKPASCELDYGNGISLTDAGAAVSCAGDTVLVGQDVLDYGQSSQRGPMVCTSSQAGVSCRDTSNGHGFDLSRQAYQLY